MIGFDDIYNSLLNKGFLDNVLVENFLLDSCCVGAS